MLSDRVLLSEILPEYYREISDYQTIIGAEQSALDELIAQTAAVLDNFFFQTMDAQTVSAWEPLLGIIGNPSLEPLDFRRARLLNRISSRTPFTVRVLRQKLDSLIGAGNYTLTVSGSTYTIQVASAAENQYYAQEVEVTIQRMKPAHIVYVNIPETVNELELGEKIEMGERIYRYRLGQWSLGAAPFYSSGNYSDYGNRLGEWALGTAPFENIELEVLKMPEISSIRPPLLQDTACFIASDVTAARVNGSILVPTVTTTVTGNSAIISYDIPTIAEVTLLELLNSDGDVLSSYSAYIPASGSARTMRHTITTKGV